MNYYEVLGIGADATDKQIKEAYRREAMKWHPDRHDGDAAKTYADRRFKDLALAYRTLRDSAARAEYDNLLKQKLQQEYEERQREHMRAEHERAKARQSAEQAQKNQQAKDTTSQSNSQQPKQDEAKDYAQQMFFEQMLDLALELAGRKFPESQIVKALVALGCPDVMAKAVASIASKGKKDSATYQKNESRQSEDSKQVKTKNVLDADLQASWDATEELFRSALVGPDFEPMDKAQFGMIRLVRVIVFISLPSLILSLFWVGGVPKEGNEVFSNVLSAILFGWGFGYSVLHIFPLHRNYEKTVRINKFIPIFRKIHFKGKYYEVNDAFIFPLVYYGFYGVIWPLVSGLLLILTIHVLILMNVGNAVHNQKILLDIYGFTQHPFFYPAIWGALGISFFDLLYSKIKKSAILLKDDAGAASKIFQEHGPKLWRAHVTVALSLLVLMSPDEFIFTDANERLVGAYKAQKMSAEELYKIGSGRFQNPIVDGTVSESSAFQYLTISAEKGHKDSEALLGYIYFKGFGGIKQNDQWARYWIDKAAGQNNPWSLAIVGDMYKNGSHGLPKNDREAVRYWMKAAETGDAYGMSQIGLSFNSGYGGLELNSRHSFYWTQRAADAGHLDAIFNTGLMFEQGIGVGLNYQQAARYYQKAADLGDAEAKKKLLALASRH